MADAELVGRTLKQLDRDRYNASLVVGEENRAGVQALCAFSAEVARVRELVSDPAPGEIRIQWWVDLLEGTEHGAARANPVADALLSAIDRYDLPTGPLRRLLAARRFDLYDDPMPDVETFEGYAGETSSVLYQFASMIVNAGNDAGGADAAGHLGVAHALIGHLRALPITAARGQIFLPLSVFSAHGVRENELFAGRDSEALRAACAQLRDMARQHLDSADKAITQLDGPVRPAFAQIIVLRDQLARLETCADRPFVTPPDLADWRKLAKLAWWTFRQVRRQA